MSGCPLVRVVCARCGGNSDIAAVLDGPDGLRWTRRRSRVLSGDGWAVGDTDEAVTARMNGAHARGEVDRPLLTQGRLEVWCRDHGAGWLDAAEVYRAARAAKPRRPRVIRVGCGSTG